MDNIIKAKFLMDGKPVSREYSYYAKEPVAVGDIVQAQTQHGTADLIVTAVNVPAEEVAPFKDKMKYIIGKKPEVIATCETCENCIACGEGDHICSERMGAVVISDYVPAKEYGWCGGKLYE